jgi:2,4-dienoyl-CoA reductase-like NADH-dependent reductase (Old Yellow Enzyme family)
MDLVGRARDVEGGRIVAAQSRHERSQLDDHAALARCADQLSVTIPFSDDLRILFSPLDVAGRRLPNRFAVQPMEGCDAEPDGAPGPLTGRRYRRYAAGGSGLIWFEATAVMPEGRANPRQLWITADNVGAFRRLVDETRACSSQKHDVLLILQLTHSGRYARPDGTPRPIVAQHNPALDSQGKKVSGTFCAQHPPGRPGKRFLTPFSPPLISDAELDQLQEAFVRAAELAAAAGFDGVDIKACHGYLVSELLAAFARPDSRYGGPFENRTRFLLEVVARIRAHIPRVFVTSRFNVHDGLPYPYGFGADAEEWAEPLELARRLRALGCPVLNISLGNPYYNPHFGRPYDLPVAGTATPDEHPLVGVARLLRATAVVQRAVPDVPVVGTGYSWLRHLFPHVAAGVVAQGGVALVGLGRLALAYPDYVKDLAEKGALDPDKTCAACSGCSQMMHDGGRVGCRVHDSDIYAEEYRQGRARAATRRRAKDKRR